MPKAGLQLTRSVSEIGILVLSLVLNACTTVSHAPPAPPPSASSRASQASVPKSMVEGKTGTFEMSVRGDSRPAPTNAENIGSTASPPPLRVYSYTARPSASKKEVEPKLTDKRGRTREKIVPVELAFDAADLYEVLEATLYELYGLNYIVDPSIKAKVTFHLKGKYTATQFLKVLNDVLQLSGLAIVPGPGSVYKVVRKQMSAGTSSVPVGGEGSIPGVGDVTRLVRLHFLSAETAAANIRPFLSPRAVVVADKASNSLIITDTLYNIEKAVGLLSAMDVDHIQDVSWKVVPLRYTDAERVADELNKIFSSKGLFVRPGTESGSYQIIAIQSLNAVLVASRWPSILDQAVRWIDLLDRPSGGGEGIYVYFVENGSAVDLAKILSDVYGSQRSEGSASRNHMATVVPAEKQPSSEKKKAAEARGQEWTQVVSGELTGEVAFIPDESTNSIVIRANERDYQIIRRVLKKLDIVPRQVLINVIIAELLLSGSVEYGIEWFLSGHWKDYTGNLVLDGAQTRAIQTALGVGTGFTAAVFDGSDFLRGLIHALGKDSELNILSSPNIMASDNKEAYIEVAEEIPIVTGEVTSPEATAVTRTIQYRKTGIILKVTPHINSSGLVKLDISQEVSSRGEYDKELKTTSILSRKAETSVVVQNGQMIVIGGLMRNRDSVSRSGMPVLRHMPLLKYLFGGTTKEKTKTELIILITPRVVRDRQEAERVSEEFSRKVESLRRLMKSFGYGGDSEKAKAPGP